MALRSLHTCLQMLVRAPAVSHPTCIPPALLLPFYGACPAKQPLAAPLGWHSSCASSNATGVHSIKPWSSPAGSWRSLVNTSIRCHQEHSSLEQASHQPAAPPVIISPLACRVVVIGWMGGKRKYIEKYAQLWQRSGDHEVLTLRTTIPMTLLRWRGVVTAGTDIDRVARMQLENPSMPTIYHIFSTGGYIHAGTMWRWMDQVEDYVMREDLLGEVAGIIFDSGPGFVHEDMASRAMVSAVLGIPAEQSGVAAHPLTRTVRSTLSWFLQRPSVKLREQEVQEAWHDLAPTCPQLYLYSDADALVPPSDVEECMRLQESRGVKVFGHKWKDSGHCEHYRKHPHEYTLQVSQFLSYALKDW